MSVLGFFIDVPLLIVTFYLMIKYREQIIKKILKIPLPNYALFLLTIFMLSLIEENINTGFTIFIIPFVPWTVPILMLQVDIVAWVMNKWSLSLKWPLIIYIVFGTLWELLVGGLRGLGESPLWLGVFMLFIYVPLSYAYVSMIPLLMRKK